MGLSKKGSKKTVYRKKRLFKKKMSKKSSYKSNSFNNAVKRVVHRMAENKTITADAANESITPCDGVTAAPYFINLLPSIGQGVTQATRVGNQIRIVRNHIKGYINMLDYNASTNPMKCPIIVKMWVVSWKLANPAFTQPSLTEFSTFFQRGSSTTNFTGGMLDMLRDVNSDAWTVHKTKTFELSNAGAFNTSLNYNPISNQNPSGVWSHKYSFNLGKYAKLLKYNDITPTSPTNKNLYLVIQTVRADGASVVAGNVYCENHFQNTLYFEDL